MIARTMRRFFGVAMVTTSVAACSPAPAPGPTARPAPIARAGAVEVTLGHGASDPFVVNEIASGVSARVSLVGARRVAAETRGDVTVYAEALGPGTHVEHHARVDGTEDFVHFPARPASEQLTYRVDVGGAAGLRMVRDSHTLELLDAAGAPRLRMAPPYGLAANGRRFSAHARVEGCAVDESPAPPWGRPVTPPGATTCDVVISWAQARTAYPATIDPAWLSTGSMAIARSEHAATLLADGRVLTAGTSLTTDETSAEVYDPATSTWAIVGSPAEVRYYSTLGTLADGRAIVVGSEYSNSGQKAASTELYDPAKGTFSPGPSMAVGRGQHAMTRLSTGALVVVGGVEFGLDNRVEILDAAAAAWKQAGVTAAEQGPFAITLADDRVLVAGGLSNGVTTGAVELVDPKTSVTTLVGSLQPPRAGIDGARLDDGTVLLVGGYDDKFGELANVDRYTPVAGGKGLLTSETAIPGARQGHRVLRGTGGKVLVIGGWSQSAKADVQLFDPTTSAWTAGGSLLTARGGHTATVLADGSLLVTGGEGAQLEDLSTVERCADGLCAKAPCSTKADCGPAETCSAGFCVALGAPGGACADGQACQSGICSQGVCCETTCDAPCISCNAKDKQGDPSGTCGPVAVGQNPSGKCKASGGECGAQATCDGFGSCTTIAPLGKYCNQGFSTCKSGQLFHSQCDGKGACSATQYNDCSPAKTCAGNGCGPNTCTGDAGCANGYTCKQGTCHGKQGTNCGDGTPCESGNCAQGICCDKPCNGGCETCFGPMLGTCTLFPKGTIVEQCFGAACACATQTCDGATSTPHLPDATTACTSQSTCGTSGTSVVVKTGVCDGAGTCKYDATVPQKDCFPYACFGAGGNGSGTCHQGCSSQNDCAPGATCKGSKCVPAPAMDAGIGDGGPDDAGPGVGGGGAAGTAGMPGVAGAAGAAGAPGGLGGEASGGAPSTPTSDDGCSCRTAGNASASPLWPSLALFLVALRRRRVTKR